jgi:hypothetical protein
MNLFISKGARNDQNMKVEASEELGKGRFIGHLFPEKPRNGKAT